MKRLMRSLLSVSVFAMMPVIAGAVGTYYDGNLYQSPQRYGSNKGGYYNNYGAGSAYNQNMQTMGTNKYASQKSRQSDVNNAKKQGFQLDVNFIHEMANWDFEMNNAGSKLRYDNLTWNVISGEGIYYFDTDTPLQMKVGARYGKQYGKSSMVDDDVSNGPYDSAELYGGVVDGYAMSVGTSEDGSQMGFNVAFGMTDFIKSGNLKITPSIGYRYFKHELITKNNGGLTMDVFRDFCESEGGEMQCEPFAGFVPFYDGDGYAIYTTDDDGNSVPYYVVISGGEHNLADIISELNLSGASSVFFNLGDSYYYAQSGTSHKYETLWHGPYVALDMEYSMNSNNFINMGIEFGLPIYESKGDQPYRLDWAHPTSVEDKGSFGDAYHLGLNATWSTAITDNVMFSLGATYDYYEAKKVDATTYLNPGYHKLLLDLGYISQERYDSYASNGWILEGKDEIESIYKSMGIRAGISVKF